MLTRSARVSRRVRLRPAAGTTIIETILATSLAIILMSSLVGLYVGAVKTVTREEKKSEAVDNGRVVTQRLSRDLTMVGMVATEDVDGDSNDIDRDVPDQDWSDSLFTDFENANTYDLVFTADVDNDSSTETIRYFFDEADQAFYQETWRWSRDSMAWSAPVERMIAQLVDRVIFDFYDEKGDMIAEDQGYPPGGVTLNLGERVRITTVSVTLVTRSEHERAGERSYYHAHDGSYWYDNYERQMQTFMIRGRNLRLGT